MILTYIQQSGSPPVGDGGDQYTGLDRFGRVVDQRWIKDSSGADLERVEYGFDRASNRVWRDNTVADALSAKQDEFYTYDGLNQLLTLQRGTLNAGKTGISGTSAWAEDFTIDPTGNWENYVNQVNGTTTLNQPRTHNAVNEVETISGSSSLMTQNAAGNMSKAPQPLDWSSAFTMTYDAWQRLVKVKNGSSNVATYAYDGQNRRTAKVTGSTTRHYYYSSQWQILEERLNTTTTADRQFVWGLMALDNLILRDRGAERFYSLQDVFSCTAIADVTGTVQERYGYNAFGLSRVMDANFNVISTSVYDWETRYDNYRFDSESSFYQVRNRYLHPTLGRWLTRDPIGYRGGINLYAYCLNNSINELDSYGEATNSSPPTTDPNSKCNENKDKALANGSRIKKLLAQIKDLGCPTPNVKCDCCDAKNSPNENGSTNCPRDKKPPNTRPVTITLCNNTGHKNQKYGDTLGTLTHELQHALDCCKGKLDNCEQDACSEIKAYDAGGSCAGLKGSAYKNCVINHAYNSVSAGGDKGECPGMSKQDIMNMLNRIYAKCISGKD